MEKTTFYCDKCAQIIDMKGRIAPPKIKFIAEETSESDHKLVNGGYEEHHFCNNCFSNIGEYALNLYSFARLLGGNGKI